VRAEIVFGGVTEVAARPLGSLTFELVGPQAAVEAAIADVRARTEVIDHGTAAEPKDGGL
jgi:D-methionine transport system ATP-binding protein